MFCKVGLFYEKNNVLQVKFKQILMKFKNLGCLKHNIPFRSCNIKRKHFRTTVREYNKVEKIGVDNFRTIIETMQNNCLSVLSYFEKRSTNASAESFYAKIKAFRRQSRDVRDRAFFMFRLAKIYA